MMHWTETRSRAFTLLRVLYLAVHYCVGAGVLQSCIAWMMWVMCYALIPPAHGTDDAHGCAAVRHHLVNAREGGNALQRMRLILVQQHHHSIRSNLCMPSCTDPATLGTMTSSPLCFTYCSFPWCTASQVCLTLSISCTSLYLYVW